MRHYPKNLWRIEGYVKQVLDGDSFWVEVDPRPIVNSRAMDMHVRLAGIDTPETRRGGPGERQRGQLAKLWAQERILESGGHCVLVPVELGKYRRTVAHVLLVREDGSELDLAESLRAAGHEK